MPVLPFMFFYLLLALSYAVPQLVQAQSDIYRWIDDKGVQHFSDTPPQRRKTFIPLPEQSQGSPSPRVVSQALKAETTPTQTQVPLAAILTPEEKKDFERRGISLNQKILILFDDTY